MKEAVIAVNTLHRISCSSGTVKPSGAHTQVGTQSPEQKAELLLLGAAHVGTAGSTHRAHLHALLSLVFLVGGPTFRQKHSRHPAVIEH